MIELFGYLCLTVATAAFWVGGTWSVRPVGWLRLAVILVLGAGFLGAAGAWINSDNALILSFAPFAVVAGMIWERMAKASAQDVDGESDGSR